jgi:hypothetical protein
MSIQFWLKTGCDIGAGDSNSQVAVMVRAELGEVWSHEQERARRSSYGKRWILIQYSGQTIE